MNKMTMFRITVFRNGTIDKIEFNVLNDNVTIGSIPKYVKMFFPSLDLDLYYPSKSRLLQMTNSTNSSSGDIGFDMFSYAAGQDGTTLANQQIISAQEDDQVNSLQEKNTSSVFDSDNNLVSSEMNANAQL